jgi:regulator of sigma E protease
MFLQILKTILIILEVIVVFNLMIIVHELGHFLAARWRGLVIEKFGIWFGKPLWKKKINGVEYSLGSIPAGGFVALPQLAPMEVMEGKVETPREQLPPISALDKIIVAFAGPLFSFLLAGVFAVIVWGVGRPVGESEKTTTVGSVEAGSPAEKAGLQSGDRIISIDGQPVKRWGGMGSDSITWRVVRSEGSTVDLEVERLVDGQPQRLSLKPEPVLPSTKIWNRKGLRQIGITPADAPLIGAVNPGSPAEAAGLKPKDTITAINGQRIYNIEGLARQIAKNSSQPLRFTVERDSQSVESGPLAVQAVVLAAVIPDGPAAKAGLKAGDRILAINQTPIAAAEKFVEVIRGNGPTPAVLKIERAGQLQEIKVTPQFAEGENRPMIGVIPQDDLGLMLDPRGRRTYDHPNPVEQLRKAANSIFDTIGAVASKKSDVKLQHMGGPVMMMRVYYSFFQLDFADGWRLAFWFSVVLNVNLAMINLLPIPVLDGGHITLALIEGLRRRPVNIRILEYVQTGCAALIIGFMVYIFFFDVQDLFGSGEKMRFKPKAAPVSEAQP